ncbi:MAG: type VI secretion system baseplate subunit TssK [Desulfovermiculus sp.]
MTAQPIYWHQGQFLQPHHLQLQEQWIRSELWPEKEWMQPFFWGVDQVVFDSTALQSGTLHLTQGRVLFPDGTLAACPDNALIEPRSLADAQVSGDQPVLVYVLAREWDPRGQNAAVVHSTDDAGAAKTRFHVLSTPEEVPDLLGDGPKAEVQFLRYTLALRFEHELDDGAAGFQFLPVARLIRRGESVVLDQEYVPPCLNMHAFAPLKGILDNILDLLTSRCRQLEGYKSPGQLESQEADMSYVILLMALRTLSRYAAQCFHLTESTPLHPWQAYAVLRQMAGELSTFALDVDVLGYDQKGQRLLPAYEHTDPMTCFTAASKLIMHIVDTIGAGPEMVLTMQPEGHFYYLDLPGRVLEGGRRFWLELSTESDPEWVLESAGRLLKLSPSASMTTLVAQAVSGIPITGSKTPPAGLPRRPNTVYFHIDTHCTLWQEVRQSGQLALFWDEAPQDLTAQIAVLGMRG